MSSIVRLALSGELLNELSEHTPPRFTWNQTDDRLQLTSDIKHEYQGKLVAAHTFTIYLMNECAAITHIYYLPEDWPWRAASLYSMSCRKYYHTPDWLDSIITHLNDLAADPQLRDECWNPRKNDISPTRREKKRIHLIAQCRHRGFTISDNATLEELRLSCRN